MALSFQAFSMLSNSLTRSTFKNNGGEKNKKSDQQTVSQFDTDEDPSAEKQGGMWEFNLKWKKQKNKQTKTQEIQKYQNNKAQKQKSKLQTNTVIRLNMA